MTRKILIGIAAVVLAAPLLLASAGSSQERHPALAVLEQQLKGKEQLTGPRTRVNRMNELMLASPATVDGTWYFRTHGHLMAVGK